MSRKQRIIEKKERRKRVPDADGHYTVGRLIDEKQSLEDLGAEKAPKKTTEKAPKKTKKDV